MPVLVPEDYVIKRLNRLNVNNSEDPDQIELFTKLDMKLHTY